MCRKMIERCLTFPTEMVTIRTLDINRGLEWLTEPEYRRLAELQGLKVKGPEIRFLPHNPEVSGSNPLPATNENRSPWGYGFLIGLRVDGYEKSLLGGFFDEP